MFSVSDSLDGQNTMGYFGNSAHEDFVQKLVVAGVDTVPVIGIKPNKFQRFGKDKKYSVRYDGDFGYFKDWSGEIEDIFWFSDSTKKELSFEERRQLKEQIETERKQREEGSKIQHEEVGLEADKIWQGLSLIGNSVYLERKKLLPVDGMRFGSDEKGNFIATALIDDGGKISTLQKIYSDGFKSFLKGGKKSGCYTEFGNTDSNLIYVCEGVATGLSILLAKPDSAVVIAYDCGNLKPVTKKILAKYPTKRIIVAGDNDLTKPHNIGKEKAEEVAKEFGLEVILPNFKDSSTKPSDFNDLHCAEGIEEVKKQLTKPISKSELVEWEPPILFDDHETPEITANILPSPLKEFAQELANSKETPEGMAVMVILSVLATTLQGKFEVKAQEEAGYKETVNLYTLTTLPPANRKSAVLNACIAPLAEWEKEQREVLEPEIKRQNSRYESEKKLIDDMRKKLKSDGDSSALIEEIANKEAELKAPENLPRLFVNDITPESLASLVAEQKNRMSVFSDEGGIIETMAGLYSSGNSNIDILLKGWDGGYLRQKRKDRELEIEPLLTINLTVQPIIIHSLGSKKAYSGKGLLERFLYCLPKSKLGYRTNDKPHLSSKIRNDYSHKIRELLNIPYQENPIILTLSYEAYLEWREFQNTIEVDLRPDGRLAMCQGWGGKICGHALRIVGLLHVAQYGSLTSKIDKDAISKALELCSLLTFHAIAAFSTMEVDPDTRDAKEILRWICDNELKFFIKAELTKRMQNRASMNAERIDKLLNILAGRNIISSPIKEGKKTFRYIVNPAIGGRK